MFRESLFLTLFWRGTRISVGVFSLKICPGSFRWFKIKIVVWNVSVFCKQFYINIFDLTKKKIILTFENTIIYSSTSTHEKQLYTP